MAITIQDAVLTVVQSELLDPGGVYWTSPELVAYYNIGITAIIAANQEAITQTVVFELVAGVEQTLPADGVRFMKLTSNVPYAGLKRSGIVETSAEAMLDAAPDWYSKVPTKYVRHCIPYPAELEPLRFRVDPPNDGTGQAYLMYSYAPPDATSSTDNFGLTEAYREAMQHFIMYCALMKNSSKADPNRAASELSAFRACIGAKEQADTKAAPALGTTRTSE